MAIQYSNPTNEVKGVLTLTGVELKKYKEILEIIISWIPLTKPQPLEELTEKTLEDLFGELIGDYLFGIGFKIGRWGSGEQRQQIYFRKEDGSYYFKSAKAPYFDVHCEKLPSEPEPFLSFFINPDKPEAMEVAFFIKMDYGCAGYLIQSRLFQLRDPALEQLVIRKSDHEGIVSVAPLTQAPKLMEVVKELLGYLKGERFEKLQEAIKTVHGVPAEFKEAAKDRYARVILEMFGVVL